jgi:hypothetical protein
MANPPEKTEAQKEAAAQTRKVIAAYRELFGSLGSRSPLQKMVWDDLRARSHVDGKVFIPDSTGQIDPLRAAIAEGHRLLFLQIEAFVKYEPLEPQTTPPVRT